MLEFLSFRKFFTPMAMQILFFVGLGICVVEGIAMIATAGRFSSALGIINGLLVLIVGPIAVRVICELIMAVFGIHDSLKGKQEL